MSNQPLQINCDLGEGVSGENKILPWIDAASVACGGHYGDEPSIRKTLKECRLAGVKVGAHPSYPDRENFGRKSMEIPFHKLKTSLIDQIQLFEKVLKESEMNFDHIKFHGALYNDAAKNPDLGAKLTEFLAEYYPSIPVLVPPFSEMERAARVAGLITRREIFGDRSYQSDFKLLERSEPKALLTDFELVNHQLESIFDSGCLISVSGDRLDVQADTICFHGDNPGVQQFLPRIRKKYWDPKP